MPEINPEEQFDPQQPKRSLIKDLHPTVYVILVLGIIFILYQFIGGAVALLTGGNKSGEIDVRSVRVILSLGQFIFILGGVLFFSKLQTPDLKNTFRLKIPRASLVLLSILGIVMIQPFLQGYIYFQDLAFNNLPFIRDYIKPIKELWDQLESSLLKIVSAHSPFEFAVVVFVICVTPAICEEFLFRGFVLTNLRKTLRAGYAIFVSGLLFAVYHFQPFTLVPLVILGWYLGFIVYYSNSILTGVICHFLNNFFAAYFMYVFGKENFDNPQLTSSETTNALIAAMVSILLFAGIIIQFYRMREKEKLPV